MRHNFTSYIYDLRQEFESVQTATEWASRVSGKAVLGAGVVIDRNSEGVMVESDYQVEGQPYVVKVTHPADSVTITEEYVLVMGERNGEDREHTDDSEVGPGDEENLQEPHEGFGSPVPGEDTGAGGEATTY